MGLRRCRNEGPFPEFTLVGPSDLSSGIRYVFLPLGPCVICTSVCRDADGVHRNLLHRRRLRRSLQGSRPELSGLPPAVAARVRSLDLIHFPGIMAVSHDQAQTKPP